MSPCHNFIVCYAPMCEGWQRLRIEMGSLLKSTLFVSRPELPGTSGRSEQRPENTGIKTYGHSLFLFVTFCLKKRPSVFHAEHLIFVEKAPGISSLRNEHSIALCCHFRPAPFFPCPVLPALVHLQDLTIEGLKCFMGGQRKG